MIVGQVFAYTWNYPESIMPTKCIGLMINDVHYMDIYANGKVTTQRVFDALDSSSVRDIELLFTIPIESHHHNYYLDDNYNENHPAVVDKYHKLYPERFI